VSHPPLQPGWIDRPHEGLDLGDFRLESGETINDFRLSYVTHGEGPETILALCAIGSTHHRLDVWIGPGRALDTARFRILCVDAIGNGLTSSPSNSARQRGLAFPRFSIRDMVESQRRLVQDHLGIARLHAVVGASMGGMQALQWAVSHPHAMARIVALVPMARTTPWSVAVNEAARRALMADPAWPDSEPESGWAAWTAIMQVLAARTPAVIGDADVLVEIEERTRRRRALGLAAVDWVYQSWAYDAHDVGTTPGFREWTAALASVEASTLVMAPPLDLYNPAEAAQAAAAAIPGARFVEIPSRDGHWAASGADPADTAFIDQAMRDFLARAGG
jgi:homoserine O-acetyltransferase